MKPETTKNKKSTLKWLKRAGIVLATLLLAPTLLFIIGWFSRDLLINELQDWYRNNNNGSLEIGDVDASFINGFPNVGFTMNDIHQTSFDTILDKNTSIYIEKARVSIAARDLISGDIKFRTIQINHSEIYSKVVSEKTVSEYVRLKKELQDKSSSGLKLPSWLSKRTVFSIRDVRFISKDSMLNKYFNLEVKEVNVSMQNEEKKSSGSISFDVIANDLGFNTNKGSYINGAPIKGTLEFKLNRENHRLNIAEFPISVGEQLFITNADFDFSNIPEYSIKLQNSQTDFQELKRLLPDSLSAKLSIYELTKPIAAELRLKGKFEYGDIPFLDADFSTQNNNGKFSDNLQMENINFAGYLSNRLGNKSEPQQQKPARRDIKIFFENFSADLEDIEIVATNSYFQSSEEALNFVHADLDISGSNETLARVLQNDNFGFAGGNFSFEAKIHGDIPNAQEVLDNSVGNFSMSNTNVVLKKNNLQLPVETLNLYLKNENSVLESLIIRLPNGEHLNFQGTIENVSSLLSSNPENATIANVSLQSETLNINDLIATATALVPPSENPNDNLKTLHETLEAIYSKFQPRFRLDLHNLRYNTLDFKNVLADVKLEDAETIRLENLNFSYENAETDLKGTLKIPEAANTYREPIYIDVTTESKGPVQVFQELFNIQLLEIQEGTYAFTGNVTGNIQQFGQLLNNANGDLKLLNTKLYYPEADIDLELDSLKVSVHDSNILLEKFNIEVDNHDPFALSGRVENFPGFLLDNLKSNGKIYVMLEAGLVNMDSWMETVNSMDFEAKNNSLKKRELAAIFSDIYKFDPEFELSVDSLAYNGLISEDLSAKVFFENDSILKLDDLEIRFRNSKAKIMGMLVAKNLSTTGIEENPFNFEFSAEASGKSEDLNELLQTVNFNLISGDFKFNGSYKGEAQDLEILNSNIQGDLILGTTLVDIEATDIQIPVDSLRLNIQNNLASLERLDVKLPGKSSIDITGKIDNFSNFINNDQAIDSHNSSFQIRSPYLDSRDIKDFLGASANENQTSEKKEVNVKDIKQIIQNINYSYFPSASIDIDSLIYDNIPVSNFKSEIGFDENGAMQISDTDFEYYGGSVNLEIEAGVTSSEDLPVKIEMSIEGINLENLIRDLDYFNSDALRQADRITGNLDLNFNVDGIVSSEGELDMESVNGIFKVDLKEASLYNYKPLMESVFLLKDERFEKLRFQPIQQSFQVVNGKVIVPRTQIQSSALQIFVEGSLKIGEYYNLWISVPWNNILKSRDGLQLPDKIAFDESGAKFYLQIIQDKNSEKERKRELKTKFRLSNRKLEKQKKQE